MFKNKIYLYTYALRIYTRNIKYTVCKIKYICPTRVNIIIYTNILNINARTHTLPFKFLTSYLNSFYISPSYLHICMFLFFKLIYIIHF